ncbi:hypothetical protein [Aquamicrobium terrae]|uniref:Uncharacterized protein n=1 Tax=Aquamicrobium terrae TaxID=1324945 RepID=A0ABV2MUY2_9HYPH
MTRKIQLLAALGLTLIAVTACSQTETTSSVPPPGATEAPPPPGAGVMAPSDTVAPAPSGTM